MKNDEFTIRNNTCAYNILTPAQGCVIEITFSPQDETRNSATFLISSDDPDTPELPVQVSGTGSFDPNIPPSISGTPITTVDEDTLYSFIPVAEDSNIDDILFFSIKNKPGWADFDTNTGALTGTPVNENVGEYPGIVITVSDGMWSTSLPAFALTVANINDAPIISGLPSTSAYAEMAYSFTPDAEDPDAGDTFIFSIENKPGWAGFDTNTGALTGIPLNEDMGTFPVIIITVTDNNGASASLPFFDIVVKTVTASPDPYNWKEVYPAYSESQHPYAVAYGDGQYVAVGRDGLILRSPDGDNWAPVSSANSDNMDLYAVHYANGMWLAGGKRGFESGVILYSNDGVNWNIPISTPVKPINSLCHANGKWIAVGDDHCIIYSEDGITWKGNTTYSGNITDLNDIAYHNSIWVAVGYDSSKTGSVATSDDGLNWQEDAVYSDYRFEAVESSNDRFTIVGYKYVNSVKHTIILTSTDGYNWQDLSKSGSEYLYDVVRTPEQWVACGAGGHFGTSADGITWDIGPSNMQRGFKSIAFNPDVNELVAVDGYIIVKAQPNAVKNHPPTISGTPLAIVEQYSDYSFIPVAQDPDIGDILTFSIENKPGWANFDTNTGALTGTPGDTDAGTYTGIVISVTDGIYSVSLSPFDIVVNANAEPVIQVTPLFYDVPQTNGMAEFNVSNTGTGIMDWTASSTNNVITGNSGNGIDVNGNSPATVTSNIISENIGWGIFCNGQGTLRTSNNIFRTPG